MTDDRSTYNLGVICSVFAPILPHSDETGALSSDRIDEDDDYDVSKLETSGSLPFSRVHLRVRSV